MNTSERRAAAALWSIPGVGPKTVARLKETFGDLGGLLGRPVRLWLKSVSLPALARRALSGAVSLDAEADRLEKSVEKAGYEVVFQGDAQWPEQLSSVGDAPPVLFAWGPGAAGRRARRAAIVGTRRPDTGALQGVRGLAAALARAGVGVISGGAEGIDQAAHAGAIDGGGETWAFVGAALEQLDPPQRRLLEPFEAHGGTLFSEFPPGTRPSKATFVRRNRLISGAADAVVVARAPEGSGALITALRAKQQGRPLLAMPGDPWVGAARGSNRLLREEAMVCLDESDVLNALGLSGAMAAGAPIAGTPAPRPLSAKAQQVLNSLSKAPCDFDTILTRLGGLSSGEVASALLELELAGAVLQKPGRRYEKVA